MKGGSRLRDMRAAAVPALGAVVCLVISLTSCLTGCGLNSRNFGEAEDKEALGRYAEADTNGGMSGRPGVTAEVQGPVGSGEAAGVQEPGELGTDMGLQEPDRLGEHTADKSAEMHGISPEQRPWRFEGLSGFWRWKNSGFLPGRLVVAAGQTGGHCCQAVWAGNGTPGVLIPSKFAREELGISVLEYQDSGVLLQQGKDMARLRIGVSQMWDINGRQALESGPVKLDGELYIPLEAVCLGFGYKPDMTRGNGIIYLRDANIHKKRSLPAFYDYRRTGRSTRVRNQGNYGTCWSFASLTALETAMRPWETMEFSADHMSLRNSFSLNQREGGEYTMSMAYLLGWQGPVLEEEDPYGDGISPEGLTPAVHVQEIQILPVGDFEAIKRAVFLYGGVQSSLYTSITDHQSRSVYYNENESAYWYGGDEEPNHDVVIVGWDDEYSRSNFSQEPPGDGAFLCVSSWGEEFGDGGYFYVSYYDSNIGKNGLVYMRVESPDNYDRIYQSDLCGWVGQVGYGMEKAYGANVYEAEEPENLEAVGFYATKENTSYRVSLVRGAEKGTDFEDRKLVADGTVEYKGFYTIPLEEPEELEKGERFAIVLEIETPEAVHPLAVEYQVDDATAEADIGDGEGYISFDGKTWASLEEQYQCNLCLKGYTRLRND